MNNNGHFNIQCQWNRKLPNTDKLHPRKAQTQNRINTIKKKKRTDSNTFTTSWKSYTRSHCPQMYSTQNLSFPPHFSISDSTFGEILSDFFSTLFFLCFDFLQKNVSQSHGNKNNNSNEEIESGGSGLATKAGKWQPYRALFVDIQKIRYRITRFERGLLDMFLCGVQNLLPASPFVWLDCWWCKLECRISDDTVFFSSLGHFVAIRHWPTKCFYRKKVLFFSQNFMFSIFFFFFLGFFFNFQFLFEKKIKHLKM